MIELYRKIKDLNQPIDSIVLNAGVGVGGAFVDNSWMEEEKMIHLNVISAVHLAKLMLRDFMEQGYGRMLFTSSEAGESPGPYLAVYSATKAFVQSFAEALRFEVEDSDSDAKITITALQPGPTDTNFFNRAHMMNTPVGQGKKDDPALVAEQGFKALMEGKDHVIAGSFRNKIQTNVSKLVSQPLAAKAQAKQTKPEK